MHRPRLSIVVPAYNEGGRLGPTLDRMLAYLHRRWPGWHDATEGGAQSGFHHDWELLICDDGSTDGSPESVQQTYVRSGLPIRVLGGAHGGKGAAVRRGVLNAQGELVLISDADLSSPIEEVDRLERAIESGYDVVIGSRAMQDSRIVTPQPRHRRLMGVLFRRVVRAFGLRGVRDSQCGFKLFRTEVARDLFGRSSIDGFAFDVEVLLLAQKRGYRLTEMGVTWADVANSRVSPLSDSARMLFDVVRSRTRLGAAADDAGQADRRAWAVRRRTLRVLIVLNVIGGAWWLIWLLNIRHVANGALYGLLLLAQAINLFQVLGYWYSVWKLRPPQRRRDPFTAPVDVFVTTCNEPLEVIERTVSAAAAITYAHRTMVLDDGRRPEVAEIARRYGARWVTRTGNKGAKAGNINHALSTASDAPFFVVLDADHAPHPDFLDRLMPFFNDHRMAWVQTPQMYVNRHASYVAGGAMDQQVIFFGPICEGQDGRDSVTCCGTNFVMRRQALDEIGGFQEDTVTEDAATGMELHARGWRSRYVSDTLAEGLAPEDLGAYILQQRRWAMGNLQMMFKILAEPFRRGVPLGLKFQYAWAASNYLSGIPTLIYLALPGLFLAFHLETVATTTNDDFVLHFLPYIAVTLLIFMRSVDGRLRFRAIQLTSGMFPVFLLALLSVLLGRKIGFQVTPKTGSHRSFYRLVMPQMAAAGWVVVTTAAGFLHYDGPSTVTNACWSVFNIVMLAGIIRAAAPRRVPRAELPQRPDPIPTRAGG